MIYRKTYIDRCIYIFFIALGLVTTVSSQSSLFREFDRSDELPSQFVYRTLEDMYGNIWICSDKGICKYDGKKIKCFDQKDGLPDNDIYKITMDDEGRIWLMHVSNKIAFIQNDSIYVLPTKSPEHLQKQYYSNKGVQGIQIGKDYYLVDKENRLSKDNSRIHNRNPNGLVWHNLYLGSPLAGRKFRVYNSTKGDSIIKEIHEIDVSVQSISQYHEPSHTFQIFSDDKLFIYDTTFVRQEVLDIQLPDDIDVLSALKDRWGNLWITSREGLFFQSYSERMHSISYQRSLENSNIIKILKYNEGAIVINDIGGIYRITDKEVNQIAKLKVHSGLIYEAEIKDDYLYIAGGLIGFIKLDLSDNGRSEFESIISQGEKDFVIGKDKRAFSVGYHLKDIDIESKSLRIVKSKYFKSIAYNRKKDELWINTNDSIYIYHVEDNIKLSHTIDIPRVTNIEYISNGNIVLSSFDNKLYVCNGIRCHENKIDPTVTIKSIKELDNRLWLNTESKLYSADITEEKKLHFKPYFDYSSLGNDVQVNDVSLINKKLILATDHGLRVIGNLRIPKFDTEIPFAYTTINGDKITDASVSVEYEDRNIELSYGSSYFGNRNQLYYDYFFDAIGRDTFTTQSESLRFDDVPTGEYKFGVKAKDLFGNTSKLKVLDITIKKPWYHRPSVYILTLIFIGAIVYFLFKTYLKRIENRNHLQQQFAEMELSALQSQMNPHFVFNAMNSIQNLITSDRPEEADLYVTRLAKLMRKYLESSKEKYITIKEELDIVKLYLQLEELRFGDKISYHLDCSISNENLAKRIPATIVQPFVENALKHGLFHKKAKGNIYIRVYEESDNIFIEIEDDGVGRKMVREIQNENAGKHKSTGMRSIENKLDVLRKLDKIDIEYTVIDIYKGEIPSGTKVLIRINNK